MEALYHNFFNVPIMLQYLPELMRLICGEAELGERIALGIRAE